MPRCASVAHSQVPLVWLASLPLQANAAFGLFARSLSNAAAQCLLASLRYLLAGAPCLLASPPSLLRSRAASVVEGPHSWRNEDEEEDGEEER